MAPNFKGQFSSLAYRTQQEDRTVLNSLEQTEELTITDVH